jgi:hypothetical protein
MFRRFKSYVYNTNNYKRLNEFTSAYGGNTQPYTLTMTSFTEMHIAPLPSSSLYFFRGTAENNFILEANAPYYENDISIEYGNINIEKRLAISGTVNSIIYICDFNGQFMNLEIPCSVKVI